MQVLVTGHKGYVGSVLTSLLVDAGFDVVGLDSDWFREATFGPPAPDVPELDKDFRDIEVRDLKELDAVLHLAALSDQALADLDRELTFDLNHKATVRLAVLARQAGVRRFVFASSCTAYAFNGAPATEETDLEPKSAYDDSKVRVEVDLGELTDERFSPVSLRAATAYGSSPRLRLDSPLNRMIAQATGQGEIVLEASPDSWCPIVHVEDLARAFIAALTAPQEAIHDRSFNVGRSVDQHTVGDLARIVASQVPGCSLALTESANANPAGPVDFRRIESELPGWDPRWEVQTGVRQLVSALAQHGSVDKPATGRLDLLQKLISEKRLTRELRWRA